MATSSEKMTDNSDELSFNDLFAQPMQIQIPIFQREYMWQEKQLNRMFEEINETIEEVETSRFLGAVIAVKRSTNPSKPQVYEVVDGQQRLSTLY